MTTRIPLVEAFVLPQRLVQAAHNMLALRDEIRTLKGVMDSICYGDPTDYAALMDELNSPANLQQVTDLKYLWDALDAYLNNDVVNQLYRIEQGNM